MTETAASMVQEISPSSDCAKITPKARWARNFFTCLAVSFPFYWTAQSLLFALPGLVRVSFLGEELKHFRVSFSYAHVVSGPADVSDFLRPVHESPGADVLLGQLLLAASAGLALVRVGRRERILSGFALAALAHSALAASARAWAFGAPVRFGAAFASFAFLAMLTFGLRWMLAGWPIRSHLARVATLILLTGLPITIFWAVWSSRGFAGFFRGRGLVLLIAATLAATLASYRPPLVLSDDEARKGWKQFAYGVGLTVALLLVIQHFAPSLNLAFARVREERSRAALASVPAVPSDSGFPRLFFQKGVNLTAEFPETYDSDGARAMLEVLPDYGVNAVALVPYGFSARGQPSVRLNPGADSWESDEGLEQLSRIAHARGVKVLLKPAVWVPGGYPGNLEFSSASDRAAWFAAYRLFIEHYARLATRIHADVFSVGVEFVHLSTHEEEWRGLIKRVREIYPGPLVYCANHGVEFEELEFWDALDYIGLQEYYPLPDNFSTDSVVKKVELVQSKFGRPVLFTEAGFPSHAFSNRNPWEISNRRSTSLEAQARGYEAILRAFYEKPWFAGVYWWAIRTDGRGGPQDRTHTPWGKPAMQVLRRWYLSDLRK